LLFVLCYIFCTCKWKYIMAAFFLDALWALIRFYLTFDKQQGWNDSKNIVSAKWNVANVYAWCIWGKKGSEWVARFIQKEQISNSEPPITKQLTHGAMCHPRENKFIDDGIDDKIFNINIISKIVILFTVSIFLWCKIRFLIWVSCNMGQNDIKHFFSYAELQWQL